MVDYSLLLFYPVYLPDYYNHVKNQKVRYCLLLFFWYSVYLLMDRGGKTTMLDYRIDKLEAEYKNFTRAKSLLLYYHYLASFEASLSEYKAIYPARYKIGEKNHV